jgi:hypothetical protein
MERLAQRIRTMEPLALVRAAILAASPHNTQPWLFKVTNSSIELYIDTKRNVGALDPYLREEHIGMGCALENLMLAAAANGYQATVTLSSRKAWADSRRAGRNLLARVDLAAGKREESELYDAIPRRHTNRSAYLPQKPIPPEFIDTLSRWPATNRTSRFFSLLRRRTERRLWKSAPAANDEIYSDPEVKRVAAIDGFGSTGATSRNFAMASRLMPSGSPQSRLQSPR